MNDAEKYLFDLNGYLVIEDVLTSDEVAFANEALDRHWDQGHIRPREQALDGGSPALRGDKGRGELGNMLNWQNRGVILSGRCWHTHELSPISAKSLAKVFGWTTTCFCYQWKKGRKGSFSMDPQDRASIQINTTSSAMVRCTVD